MSVHSLYKCKHSKTDLPMHKTSTQVNYETKEQPVKGPKTTTVEFLKQFARVYSFSVMMPAGLGNFLAN